MGRNLAVPILIGKALRVVTRLRGGGSAFPGWVVQRIAPRFVESVVGQLSHGVVVVLGSNGKSTTTNMVAQLAGEHGLRFLTNPSGANMPQGIASSLLGKVSLTGRLEADIGVIEVDEAYAVALCRALKPRAAVVLNVQIDQIYRLHEPDRVARMFRDALREVAETVVLNRDDAFLSALGAELEAAGRVRVEWFGVAPEVLAAAPHGQVLARDYRNEGALRRPHPARAEVTGSRGREATIAWDGTPRTVRLSARGLHQAVDAAAATTLVAAALGERFDIERAMRALGTMKTVYGRGETIRLGDRTIEILLLKNLASLQMNLDALEGTPDSVVLAFDEHSRDPSWLFAVDFSALRHVDFVAGPKAVFLALRLKYADVSFGAIETSTEKAVQEILERPRPASGVHTLILDYDQMLLVRRSLGFRDLEAGVA